MLFLESLADHIGADLSELESILVSLTLTGSNLDVHTRSGESLGRP